MRNHVAVPVAFAEVSELTEFKVNTPELAAGANVLLQVNCARIVVSVPPVAG
jgi:hypothetical protein